MTAHVDPFRAQKTLAMNFFVHDPFTHEAYSRDPRNIARKAEQYITESSIADTGVLRAGGGVLHLRLRPVRLRRHGAFHEVDSIEGWWNTGADEAGGNQATRRRTRAATSPSRRDHYADLRDEMVRNLAERPASSSRGRTTRSAPAARPRSTTSSTRSCTPPTTCSCSSTS